MAKKIINKLKLNLPAGTATPAPPVGPILGQAGINMMDFLKQYNAATQDKKGQVIPAEITVYQDRSFTFHLRLSPVAALIKQTLKLKKGSGTPKRETLGKLTSAQLEQIAQTKLPDLNTTDLSTAKKIIAGTAKTMGVEIIN
jgi:large subunit ribosomal protein L11